MRYLAILAYILTIPAANWFIGNVGTCSPHGPCVIPVGFDLYAPSGVLLVGLALVLRDVIHERFGVKAAVGSIVAGSVISLYLAPAELAVASLAAFALSELSDLTVYAPLHKRRLYSAVILSGFVGAVIDSAVFLLLAFGSLDFITGQVVGKLWMTIAALPVIWVIRNRCNIGSHKWRLFRDYGYGFTEKCEHCGKVVDRGSTIGN